MAYTLRRFNLPRRPRSAGSVPAVGRAWICFIQYRWFFSQPSALCASSVTDARAADRITDAPFATRSEVIALHATSQPLATQIALDVTKQGGSAVDGRRHAATGARADRAQPDRFRHESAGGR